MPSCEKCWDRVRGPWGDTYEAYIHEVKNHSCTPEEQAGESAFECPQCHRRAMHQHAKICMACDFNPAEVAL